MNADVPTTGLDIDADGVLDLARAVCRVPSPASNELAVAEVVAQFLDLPGIDVHVEEVVAGRANLIATVRGRGERAPLVLNGHLDAAIPEDGWSKDPYRPWTDDGRLYGAGISDMKGAVAAMAGAVRAAALSAEPLPGDLILQAVMHHDTIGLGTKYLLASEGPTEGYAVCGEPSDLAVHTANGGALKFQIDFVGLTGHISRMEGSRDAMVGAVNAYQAIRNSTIPHEPHPRLPDLPRMLIGEVAGGIAPGAVADAVTLRGDLRTVPGMRRDVVRRLLDDIASDAAGPDIAVRTRIIAAQRPFIGPTGGRLIEAILSSHEKVFGAPTKVTNELPGQAFVTDAADLAHVGLETVVYGVGSWHYAPDESISIADLLGSAQVYLDLARRL